MESLSVLVVEDEATIHGLIRDALEEAGFSVTTVLTARQAIDTLEAPDAAFAALVTDIGLERGGATGWDVARRARELEPSLPVVYMTGDSAADWPSNGVPGSVLITKPFAPAQAVTAVTTLLNACNPPLA